MGLALRGRKITPNPFRLKHFPGVLYELMMPHMGEQPIMQYVRTLETKCRDYEAAQESLDRKVFLIGFLLGFVFCAILAACYLWRHGR